MTHENPHVQHQKKVQQTHTWWKTFSAKKGLENQSDPTQIRKEVVQNEKTTQQWNTQIHVRKKIVRRRKRERDAGKKVDWPPLP